MLIRHQVGLCAAHRPRGHELPAHAAAQAQALSVAVPMRRMPSLVHRHTLARAQRATAHRALQAALVPAPAAYRRRAVPRRNVASTRRTACRTWLG